MTKNSIYPRKGDLWAHKQDGRQTVRILEVAHMVTHAETAVIYQMRDDRGREFKCCHFFSDFKKAYKLVERLTWSSSDR